MEWHHIVEQRPANISQFGTEKIHNIDNMIAIPTDVHRKISGYYSSKISEHSNLRVRDWLNGQSYEKQYEFGLEVLKKYGYSARAFSKEERIMLVKVAETMSSSSQGMRLDQMEKTPVRR